MWLNQFGLGNFKLSQVNPQGSEEKNGKIAIGDNVIVIADIEIMESTSIRMITTMIEENEKQVKTEAEL